MLDYVNFMTLSLFVIVLSCIILIFYCENWVSLEMNPSDQIRSQQTTKVLTILLPYRYVYAILIFKRKL